MTAKGWVLVVVLALVVTGGVIFGGWEASWWFRNQNVNRETHVQRHSIQWQQSYETAAQQGIASVRQLDVQIADPSLTAGQKAGLQGERVAIVAQTCQQAALIDPSYATPDVTAFTAANCH